MKLEDLKGFIWDACNQEKSARKHGVGASETEEVFFNFNIVYENGEHSQRESRFRLLGMSNEKRILFVVFTARHKKIRVISSRPGNKKERTIYHEAAKKSPKI